MPYSLILSAAPLDGLPRDDADLHDLMHNSANPAAATQATAIPVPHDFDYTISTPPLLGNFSIDREFSAWLCHQIATTYPDQFVSEIAAAPDPQALTLFSGNAYNTRFFGTFWIEHPVLQMQFKISYQLVQETKPGVYQALSPVAYHYQAPQTPRTKQPVSHTFQAPDLPATSDSKHHVWLP